jgi:hypothetical protein
MFFFATRFVDQRMLVQTNWYYVKRTNVAKKRTNKKWVVTWACMLTS